MLWGFGSSATGNQQHVEARWIRSSTRSENLILSVRKRKLGPTSLDLPAGPRSQVHLQSTKWSGKVLERLPQSPDLKHVGNIRFHRHAARS